MPESPPEPAAAPSSSKLRTFFSRLGSTVALWGVVIAAVVFNQPAIFLGLVALLTLGGVLEFFKMASGSIPGLRAYRNWIVGVAGLWIGLVSATLLRDPGADFFHLDALCAALALGGTFALSFRSAPEGQVTLMRIFASVFAYFYVEFLFGFVTHILYFFGGEGEAGSRSGVFYVIFLVAVTKFTDMGAYFIGTLIGKHKMIPHISPKKTWQGFGGAIAGANLAAFGMLWLFGEHLPGLTAAGAAILAVCLGCAAVAGDLAESVLKRCFAVKDSGRFLPGIGGALDLIDSILFTAPILYVFLRIVA